MAISPPLEHESLQLLNALRSRFPEHEVEGFWNEDDCFSFRIDGEAVKSGASRDTLMAVYNMARDKIPTYRKWLADNCEKAIRDPLPKQG